MEENRIRLVVDINVLFSAILCEGKDAELLFDKKLDLSAPDYLMEELRRLMPTISARTNRTYQDVERMASMLSSEVKVVPSSETAAFLNAAKALSPDPDDAPYFALALKTGAAIWSNDKLLKEQIVVKVYSTYEVGLLGT